MKRFSIWIAAAFAALCLSATSPAIAQIEPDGYAQYAQGEGIAVRDAATYDASYSASAKAFPAPSGAIDGTAEVSWGDHLLTILTVFGGVIALAIAGFAATVYAKATGKKLEAQDADRLREYTKYAYDFAVNAIAPAFRGKKLTVKDASPVVEWILEYGDDLFPDLVAQFGGRENQRLRAWSTVDLAEGEAIPLAKPQGVSIASPANAPADAAPPSA